MDEIAFPYLIHITCLLVLIVYFTCLELESNHNSPFTFLVGKITDLEIQVSLGFDPDLLAILVLVIRDLFLIRHDDFQPVNSFIVTRD